MSDKKQQTGLGEFILLAMAAGLAFSGFVSCFDVLHNARACSPIDLLIATGFLAITAVPAAVIVCGGTVFVIGLYGAGRDRRLWIPLLAALTAMAILGAIIARLDTVERAAYAWLLWPAFIPTGIIAFGATFNRDSLLDGWHAMVVGLIATLMCILLTCVVLVTNVALPGMIIYVGIPVLLLAFAYLAGRMVHKQTAGIGLVIAGSAAILGLAVSLWVDPASAPAATSGANSKTVVPNIVMVVLDTTRRDHLGVYGRNPTLTPKLDALAKDAVVYEYAYSNAPWTVPSHASLFTGLHPVTHGCTHEHHLWLDDHFITLSDRLNKLGYQTVALNSNPYLMETNLLQGFDSVAYLVGDYEKLAIHGLALTVGAPEKWVDKGSAEAIDELNKWFADERDPSRPFFMFVNLYEGHREYVPPHSVRDELKAEGFSMFKLAEFWAGFNPNLLQLTRERDEEAQNIVRRLYAAEIRYQDRMLGEFFENLARRTNLDDAVVIVTADHGENLGEEGRWEHLHEINEALIHVPLIVRFPKKEYAGVRQAGLCQLSDLVPTLFDVLDRADDVATLPGRSLRPSTFEPYTDVFAQVAPYYLHFPFIEAHLGFKANLSHFNRYRRVIRSGDMKFVWGSDGHHELYDIRRDPTESTNMIEDQPDVAKDLHDRLMSWWEQQPKYVPPPESNDPNSGRSEVLDFERLKSLGYIGG